VITGAGSGIGYETACAFASEGPRGLVLADINLAAAQACADFVNTRLAPGSTAALATAVACDVSKEAEVEAAMQLAVTRYGRLDVVFNNAGIMHPRDDNAQTTPNDVWDLTFDVNVKGVLYGCRHAIPRMLANPGGGAAGCSIINTASFVAKLGAATPQLAYTASKGAVLAMTRELAVLHARDGIRVNALCPGPLRTPLLMAFLDTEEKRARRMVHLPMGRFGEAVEQARAVLFLASNDSSYVTGTDFMVDGGLSAAYVTATGEWRGGPVPQNYSTQ
jgi:NAD(P)-dependent dehydrogenase (short-subunit alcohol dehydrogenase family)